MAVRKLLTLLDIVAIFGKFDTIDTLDNFCNFGSFGALGNFDTGIFEFLELVTDLDELTKQYEQEIWQQN